MKLAPVCEMERKTTPVDEPVKMMAALVPPCAGAWAAKVSMALIAPALEAPPVVLAGGAGVEEVEDHRRRQRRLCAGGEEARRAVELVRCRSCGVWVWTPVDA